MPPRKDASADPPPSDTPPPDAPEATDTDRIALLEQALAEMRRAHEQQANEWADKLAAAMARPTALKAPGLFVGREGMPDSPVDDHYEMVLITGELVATVHPNVTHFHDPVRDQLIPVVAVLHSAQVQAAQHPAGD